MFSWFSIIWIHSSTCSQIIQRIILSISLFAGHSRWMWSEKYWNNYLKNPILYSPKITEYTAQIAKVKKIRLMLKNYQIKFSKKKRVILEGRDMGILFPNADIKIFFKCSLKVAAKRRFKEFKKTDKRITLKKVEKAIFSETIVCFGCWNNWKSPTTNRTIMPHIIKFFKFIYY